MGRYSGKFSAVRKFAGEPEPAVVVVDGYDFARAERLMADAVSMLTAEYPAGAVEWLQANRPDVLRMLTEVERAVDEAHERRDMPAFAEAVEKYARYYRRAFRIYAERPPVIETQGDLLLAAG